MTVSCRRSGRGAARGGCTASRIGAPTEPNEAPQSAQNRLPAGFSALQELHIRGSGEPHSPQNFLSFDALAPQRGQTMRPPCSPRLDIEESTAALREQRQNAARTSGIDEIACLSREFS
jgi:hypothetical protein